ncbi:DUF4173 domain-containing protein [Pedobacter heparinus]|uniref:Uncharacterized protein n=1 Tax=Pedobacter heparinus (strain ATCC 13125 / DSM 2366 / CIP 104194 / JCM 7457 / NBRC 12017 / NCIMB 9290 / NRRL B-14731 / HIM 762-3) TaxID=485917 RepID=C6Y2K4_PEDHD|nr:DUF4173 domain-containing protein [Pedobacter heparinus]ACU05214.1 hypothetical protein Phep_3016 [Pedobacter heparinus DSM 2366]
MKQKINLQLMATLTGGLLFNYLFWMQKQAINLLIYTIFILTIILMDKEKSKNIKSYLAGASLLLASLLVVFNKSALTIITWYISLAIVIGITHFQLLRSIFTIILAAILQFVTAPVNLVKKILGARFSGMFFKPLLSSFKYIIIPLIAITFFITLYSAANNIFASYVEQFFSGINTFINNIFNFLFADLNLPRFLHIILGIVLAATIFIRLKDLELEKAESGCNEQLIRQRRNKKNRSVFYDLSHIFAGSLLKRKTALKTENIIGIISFSALNLLILALNLIDISTLWLGETTSTNASYSEALHDGAEALIFSIIMAMLVIVYFFSGNLNFYSKNRALRLLAYLWIFQNAFLIASVLLRDLHYISALGLTYKRIGVMVFLLLCIIGLITVYLKVSKQKTFFYLCKVNGFAWYVLLLVFSFINWDVFIVSYNINHKESIRLDFDHLIGFSDKTLPLLHQNKQLLSKYLGTSVYASRREYDPQTQSNQLKRTTDEEQKLAFENVLKERISIFREEYNHGSWLSWNYRDWQTQQYLLKNRL